MFDFIRYAMPVAWPAVAVLVAEVLLHVWIKRGWSAATGIAAGCFVILTLACLFGAFDWLIKANRFQEALSASAATVFAPLMCVMLAVAIARKVADTVMRHMVLVGLVLLTMTFFPLWGLLIACGHGSCL